MRNGFSFKDIHSSSFHGITVKTKDRPILPQTKTAEYSADNMNGAYDFSDYTGQTFYDMRVIQIEIAVTGENLIDLQYKLSHISMWLSGKGDIIFDDLPTVKWTGRVADSVSYMPERGGKNAVLAVSFRCQPFSRSLWDTFDGPKLGDYIPLGSHIMLDAREYLTLSSGTHSIDVEGSVLVEPVIKSSGTLARIAVTNSLGEYVMTSEYTGSLTINCEKKQVYSGTENLMKYITGDFPILVPGENTIKIRAIGKIEIHYVPRFFYDRGMYNAADI